METNSERRKVQTGDVREGEKPDDNDDGTQETEREIKEMWMREEQISSEAGVAPPQPKTSLTPAMKGLLRPSCISVESDVDGNSEDDPGEISNLESDLVFATPPIPTRNRFNRRATIGLGGSHSLGSRQPGSRGTTTPNRKRRQSRSLEREAEEGDVAESGVEQSQATSIFLGRNRGGRPKIQRISRGGGRPQKSPPKNKVGRPRKQQLSAANSSEDRENHEPNEGQIPILEHPVRSEKISAIPDEHGNITADCVGGDRIRRFIHLSPEKEKDWNEWFTDDRSNTASNLNPSSTEQREVFAELSSLTELTETEQHLEEQEVEDDRYRTRGGRVTNRPRRYVDYVMPEEERRRKRRVDDASHYPADYRDYGKMTRFDEWVNGYLVKAEYARRVDIGKRNYICEQCGAKHFKEMQACCYRGQVFMPPLEKLPDLLDDLFYKPAPIIRQKYGISKPHFFDNIIPVNTLHSTASISCNQLPVGKHGQQTVKIQGSVQHVISTLQPGEKYAASFANFYPYTHDEAAKLRGEHYLARTKKIDQKLLNLLSKCMEEHYELVGSYKMMKDLVNDTAPIEMRIVDRDEWKGYLQGHRGVYKDTRECGDYVCAFYDANLEGAVKPRGITVFQDFRCGMIPMKLSSWMGLKDTMCYPFIFPKASGIWEPKKYLRYRLLAKDKPVPFEQRLQEYIEEKAAEGLDVTATWDKLKQEGMEDIPDDFPEDDHDLTPEQREMREYWRNLLNVWENEQIAEDMTTYNEDTRRAVQEEIDAELPETEEIIVMDARGEEDYPRRQTRLLEQFDLSLFFDEPDEQPLTTGEVQLTESEDGQRILRFDEDEGEDVAVMPPEPLDDGLDLAEEEELLEQEGGGREELEENDMEAETAELDDNATEWERKQRRCIGKAHTHVSQREALLYRCQDRDMFPNRIAAARRLGQLYVIDTHSQYMEGRLNACILHHTVTMHTKKSSLLKAAQKAHERNERNWKVGAVTYVPASFPGSPRHQRMHFENAVALSNQLGKPTWFVTFTCNVNWPEIKENLAPGQTWADNSMLVNQVFHNKFNRLLEKIYGKWSKRGGVRERNPGIFGACNWYVASVEFQQRGPPHAHIVVSVKNPPKTAADIDKYCQAFLPPLPPKDHPAYEEVKELRELVECHMIHRPCENNEHSYCRDPTDPKLGCPCRKGFPKAFQEQTELGDMSQPTLRRPNNGEKVTLIVRDKKNNAEKLTATNQHVVPYNETLLKAFDCHLNVIPVASGGVLHYLFKYVFKGTDRAIVEITLPSCSVDYQATFGQYTVDGHVMYPTAARPHRTVLQQRKREAEKMLKDLGIEKIGPDGKKRIVINEARYQQDMRAVTAMEAMWDTAGYRRYFCSHVVNTNFVHMPDEEPLQFKRGAEEETVLRVEEKGINSKLKAWFKLNASTEPDSDDEANPHNLTFEMLPKYYSYSNGTWRRHKINLSGRNIGRIKSVNPRNTELYAMRLLVRHVKGPKSFKDLKSTTREIDGRTIKIVHMNFVDAAKAHGLMDDEREWHDAIRESAQLVSPKSTRRLFVTILAFCAPKNVVGLWNDNKVRGVLLDDIDQPQEILEYAALKHIEKGLMAHGIFLSDVNLSIEVPNLTPNQLEQLDNLAAKDYVPKELTPEQYAQEGRRMIQTLNPEQENAFKKISFAVEHDKPKMFFINGSGGTGKTYVYKTLYNYLKGKGKKVLCVAHTGIAASLLPYGQTAHRAFAIPLQLNEQLACQIQENTDIAKDLCDYDVLIWDEVAMSDYRAIQAVDVCLRTISGIPQPFGGKTVVFGGDFKQTLPIVAGLYGNEPAQYTLQNSELWWSIERLDLTINQRAAQDAEFSRFLEDVGHGRNWVQDEEMDGDNEGEAMQRASMEIELPTRMIVDTEEELLVDFYDSEKLGQSDLQKLRELPVILTPDNKTSLELNDKILSLLNGQEREYRSIDTHNDTLGLRMLDPEIYNDQTPSGLPPHLLRLKANAIVILLKNLCVDQGLCNGTRLRVLELKDNIIVCEPLLKGRNTKDKVLIPRTLMTPINATKQECAFTRQQFPLRLAYSMTINKSQGQTLSKVGLVLRSPVFSHGQLYVGLSRVQKSEDVKIVHYNAQHPTRTQNIVCHQVLL